MQDYNSIIMDCFENFLSVKIPDNQQKKIDNILNELVKQKFKEYGHIIDNRNELKRWRNGLMGEMAVQLFLGIDFLDLSVGYSIDYNHPDIEKFGIGVKTVEWGKFPIINKKNEYPQLFVIINNIRNIIYICGVATTEVLNTYQDDNLVLDVNLRKKNTKSGFYGFKFLLPLNEYLQKERI